MAITPQQNKTKTMLKSTNDIMQLKQTELRSYIRQLNKTKCLAMPSADWRAMFADWINGQVKGYKLSDYRAVAIQRRFPLEGWQLPAVGGAAASADAKPSTAPVVTTTPVDRKALVESLLNGIDRDECVAICNEIIADRVPTELPTEKIIIRGAKTRKITAPTHSVFPSLLRKLAAGEDVYCHGPAGTGKTELGKQLAEALELNFYFTSKISAEHHFQGFVDGGGQYHETPFFKAFTRGGLFLFDEMDASNPNVLTRLNGSLANRRCDFPHGIFEAHKDFVCLGAGNTALGGASREHNARQQQDSALIDRFLFVPVGYDEKLERSIAGVYENGLAAAERVQAVRRAVERLKIRHTVSMRATVKLAKLLAIGETQKEAESAAVWKALDSATIAKIEADIKSNA